MTKISKTVKSYAGIYKELFKVRNPHLKRKPGMEELKELKKSIAKQQKKEKKKFGARLPTKKVFFELVTSRNKQLISASEQNRLRKTVVGCFGMSVGSSIAITWTLLSRCDNIKIVDLDNLDATNLNRLPCAWSELGKSKVGLVEERLCGINPFIKVVSSRKKDKKSITQLFVKKPRLNVVVDEIDDFEGKLLLRQLSKKYSVPLVSAADVGDNVVLDIERYDVSPQPKHFLGRIEELEKINFSRLSEREKKKLIIKLVGFEQNSVRMLESLMLIGGSITTWPQLGSTAALSGAVVATTIKKIVLGENVESGRYYISLDEILVEGFNAAENLGERKDLIEQLKYLLEKE